MKRTIASIGVSALLLGCSATSSDTSSGGSGAGAQTGSGGGGQSGAGPGGSANGGSGGISIDGGGGTPTCFSECSSDGKAVVDCHGNVVKTCTGADSCAFGICTNDPCAAAAQSGSTNGCDFWALKTDVIFQGQGACFATFIANTWSTAVHIQAERDGAQIPASAIKVPVGQGNSLTYSDYDPNVGLAPGQVAILFLSRGPGFIIPIIPDCPVPAALPVETGVAGTGLGKAFHITTDQPVVAYQMLPYGGGASAMTSATLLMPTGAWGTNYVAINAYLKNTLNNGQPSLAVLAAEDGTEVTILPNVDVAPGPGVPGAAAGAPMTVQLNRGDYLQVTQDAELSGSPIESNKPVALFGASSCMNVPVDAAACDTAHQQIPPIQALGYEYVGLNHENRTSSPESEPWRIMGMVEGTTLTWTPAPPSGAPTSLGLGEVVEFHATDPFVVKSQDADHPFYLSSFMSGGEKYGGIGDPEWVNEIPAAQFLKQYVLFTDPTYSDTSLAVTRSRDVNGQFADVNLDCAGALVNWNPIGDYEVTYVNLVTGNFQNVGNCSNGRHEIKSDAPFGVTVWGWGDIPGIPGSTSLYTQYVSYAYPAGAGVKSINKVSVPIPK